jgi:alpha-L-fucosidase
MHMQKICSKSFPPWHTIVFIFLCTTTYAQQFDATWASLDNRRIPPWFEDAKFGIFIHWGVYSVPAWRKLEPGLYASYAEWYYAKVMYNPDNEGIQFHKENYGEDFEYRDFAPLFKAELFDPVYWADLFRKSGARYVVLTSKHHDGYCLWPTDSPYKKQWNAMEVGPKRDIVGDLTEAVRAAGLRMGIYYSMIEWESSWTHRTETGYYVPDHIVQKYKISDGEYVGQHVLPQLKELVTRYKPSLIFADGGEWDGSEDYWKTKEFLAWLYNNSPVADEVVVNDRFAKNMPGRHGDYFSSEYKDMKEVDKDHPWEESRGIGGSYGFNRAENIEDYSTSEGLILELIDIVSRGGNLLLNVGPTADGRIPVIMQERLIEIGEWLKINGEAIYGTRRRRVPQQVERDQTIYFTTKDSAIYCLFRAWGDDIHVNLLPGENIEKITMLGYDGSIPWHVDGNTLTIDLPKLTIKEIPCLYAWSIKIKLGKI